MADRHDGRRLWHTLGGRPVDEGAELELLLADGGVIRGRYRWAFVGHVSAELVVPLAGQPNDQGLAGVAVQLPPWARLRWPS